MIKKLETEYFFQKFPLIYWLKQCNNNKTNFNTHTILLLWKAEGSHLWLSNERFTVAYYKQVSDTKQASLTNFQQSDGQPMNSKQ